MVYLSVNSMATDGSFVKRATLISVISPVKIQGCNSNLNSDSIPLKILGIFQIFYFLFNTIKVLSSLTIKKQPFWTALHLLFSFLCLFLGWFWFLSLCFILFYLIVNLLALCLVILLNISTTCDVFDGSI